MKPPLIWVGGCKPPLLDYGFAFGSELDSELLALIWQSHYSQYLKALSAAFCIASAILAAGCADPLEKPMAQEAGEKFQRGITGHGTLGPMDRPNDPSKPPEQDSQHP